MGIIGFELIDFKPYISDEGKGLCMYDKNEVACCTKKLELFQSWQKKGWIEGHGPYENLLKQHNVEKNLKYIYDRKITVSPNYVYSVRRYMRSKWNFECPTHHPVPTVAILLGLFEIDSVVCNDWAVSWPGPM